MAHELVYKYLPITVIELELGAVCVFYDSFLWLTAVLTNCAY